MEHISDELLVESYYEAKKLNLSPDFLYLIEKELKRRNLSLKTIQYN